MEGLTNTTILWRGSSGGSIVYGNPPAKCMNLVAKPKSESVELTWKDPDDIIVPGSNNIKWSQTVIVRKIGSAPTDINDGVIAIISNIRNQYEMRPFIDSGLINHTEYFYAAFSCSEDGLYNTESIYTSAIPIPYRVMTISINCSDSNPNTCGSYAVDAINMTPGKHVTEWDEFFGYKPCLFKDGKVVGYLNPNDYTQFENGEAADITSGNAGDVMIEFPRRGVKISKSNDILNVSMTNDPDNPEFTYYAHTRENVRKEYFYVGAYLGYIDSSNKLRSLSGKSLTYSDDSYVLSTMRNGAVNTGTSYFNIGFYQYTFIQAMYLLQYKGNLNSQNAHGFGYCGASNISKSGNTNNKGMMYGSSSDTDHIKLFGIEDLWGNLACVIDGCYMNSDEDLLITSNNNDFGSTNMYKKYNFVADYTGGGYIRTVTRSSETGFIPSNLSGSLSTYFCDHGDHRAGYPAMVGGNYHSGAEAGIFFFSFEYKISATRSETGGRLCYL